MPIVNQSRETGFHWNSHKFWDRSYSFSGWATKEFPPVPHRVSHGFQSTRSYRSISSSPDVVDGEDLLAGLRNRQEFAKKLRDRHTNKWDNGHEFFTEKQTVERPNSRVENMYVFVNPTTHNYSGDVSITQGVGVNLHPPISAYAPSDGLRAVDGRKLMNSVMPSRPEVALAQALSELREKLPSLVGYATFLKGPNAKSLGGEHLNIEFGIKPLISDIQGAANGILNFVKIAEQYQRDSGAVVRRKQTLSQNSKTVDLPNYVASISLGTRSDGMVGSDLFYSGGAQCSCRVYDTYNTTVKFSGAFSYHLAEADSFLGKLKRYEQLAHQALGLRFTPETLYELTPWSWLFDWFGDAGTFVSNITALSQDSLVMRYGYVMHHTVASRYRRVNVMPAPRTTSFGNFPRYAEMITGAERKTRMRASPYGFGITEESFSGKQWAILAALGMTKAPTSLRG